LQANTVEIGNNINGPSLIKAPNWLPNCLGRYYLYFGHHFGQNIRMAFSNNLTGPWNIYKGGVLHLKETPFTHERPNAKQPQWATEEGVDGLYPHIASPDVHINTREKSLEMFFHGLDHDGEQRSLRALSNDGLTWWVQSQRIKQTYLRVFRYKNIKYALGWGGQILRQNSDGTFELGPWSFGDQGHRHASALVQGDKLHVVWTRIGDAPEQILYSTIDISLSWRDWYATEGQVILKPKFDWEGANLPISNSTVGGLTKQEHALRDPFLFEQNEEIYMLYAGGGETCIGIAKLSSI
tara:strand:- start:1123 stop:2010 length:888 start_codon:yes stop_codon:yes gene_type:complete